MCYELVNKLQKPTERKNHYLDIKNVYIFNCSTSYIEYKIICININSYCSTSEITRPRISKNYGTEKY